jgi:hypothetical protein
MGSSGGGTQTTIQKNDPPAYVQPYATSYLDRANNLSGQPFNPYAGQRIAGLTPEQQQGLNLTSQRALSGSPVTNAAKSNLEATLRGDFLSADSNPYVRGTIEKAMGDVQSRVNSQFSGNNFGGTAHQEWLGSQLADTALPIYAQNYDNERTRQMQANLFAPQMAQSDYNDLSALLGVGDVRQANSQQGLDFLYDQWQQQQQHPYNQLSFLGGAIAGSPGMQSTTTGPNPYQSNRTATALGGAAGGAALGSMVAGASSGAIGGPVGMGVGAGLGLLGGLFL